MESLTLDLPLTLWSLSLCFISSRSVCSPFTFLQKSLISCRFGTGDCWIHIFLGHACGCTNLWTRRDLDGFVPLHGVAVSCRSLEVTKQTNHSCFQLRLNNFSLRIGCCHCFQIGDKNRSMENVVVSSREARMSPRVTFFAV